MSAPLHLHVAPDPTATAERGARFLASEIAQAIVKRGQAHIALSGGSTPWAMLRELRAMDMPWDAMHVYQVDERVAPDGDPDRNLTGLRNALLDHVPVHAHPLEVDPVRLDEPVLPNRFDVVHLGLGDDGHTASLVPDDPALEVSDRPLAVTAPYRGRQRVTMTFPVIDAARTVLWLACGSAKAPLVVRAVARDLRIPAGRVANPNQHWFLDEPAAAELPPTDTRSTQ